MLRTAASVKRELRALANPEIAAHSQRFSKKGPGEYGEGDSVSRHPGAPTA